MQKTENGLNSDARRERLGKQLCATPSGYFAADRREGAMLIIALGVLTLLAVLGASFAQLMRLERKAANNYVDAQRMEMMSSSALDMVIAKLHEASNHYSWSFYGNTSWLFRLPKEDDLAHAGLESRIRGSDAGVPTLMSRVIVFSTRPRSLTPTRSST